MSARTLHPTPRSRDVLREQVRAVGLSLRLPALAAAALAAVATLLVAGEALRGGGPAGFAPQHQILPGVVGLLLPVAVWRGEAPFGDGFLWTLPVDRRRHALTRVLAGWAWLMAAVALFVLWLAGMVLLTGGNPLGEAAMRAVPAALAETGVVDGAAVRTVRWTPHPLLWLVPFTAATATYLLSSALALGVRRPGAWIAGAVLALAVLAVAADTAGRAAEAEWLVFAPSRVLASFLYGHLGLARLLTAGSDFVTVRVPLPTGESVAVWHGPPDVRAWAAATLLWTAAGLAALWAAAFRHRERRGA
jgi:hypothetical protein